MDPDVLKNLLKELRGARDKSGVSLGELARRTGMDRSAIAKLENGRRLNPTIETLSRYAEAVGKRLVISLADVVKEQ